MVIPGSIPPQLIKSWIHSVLPQWFNKTSHLTQLNHWVIHTCIPAYKRQNYKHCTQNLKSCVHTVVTHPCDIPPLAQARPMMLCIYTRKTLSLGYVCMFTKTLIWVGFMIPDFKASSQEKHIYMGSLWGYSYRHSLSLIWKFSIFISQLLEKQTYMGSLWG